MVGVIRQRRIDFISGIALASIIVSLIMILLLGGDERLYLIRESFFTAAIGLAFLISLLLPRPLTFYLARTLMVGNTQKGVILFETKWRQSVGFRAGLRKNSLVWGLGLIVEAGLRTVLVFLLNTAQFLAASPFITYGIIGLLIIWSVYEARH
ncbi:MAG: hypothetical protein J2P37_20350 [Ktedonobacteraceae bacterium]|nr:hypothetical protein [Ktedonobacteraceae bacterium]